MFVLYSPGETIQFFLDSWDSSGKHELILRSAEVQSLCKDPLNRRPMKYIVIVDGESYGIPVSDAVHFSSSSGSGQLLLF